MDFGSRLIHKHRRRSIPKLIKILLIFFIPTIDSRVNWLKRFHWSMIFMCEFQTISRMTLKGEICDRWSLSRFHRRYIIISSPVKKSIFVLSFQEGRSRFIN